ncbi:MAG: histidine phosphatase family protein [Candidatus Omnitrophica bacterium]|nr:histidine phosphatase family protein [Candidatus Omnitrophota bacterium]MBU0897093.1 histidine phosphatase family protein [Candidatus Omnitrophota bacterium]MBU1133869.1 histidine phosphatase family protein [Candidatus Omnitrophota bacterium]MBU1367769.1 histidine phosphatase family protein [Candidatus Omnitrophota bacterium]MBU1523183.1 histidine phosphatase family protein [Candidatus Omnitrophota bacterium]
MNRLILIRHGETDYNLQNRYCGFSNPPLNKNGLEQAEKLSTRLNNFEIDRTSPLRPFPKMYWGGLPCWVNVSGVPLRPRDKIYCSDLKRAHQTAEVIFKQRAITKLADFREMNFGVFEGLNCEEIIEKYPKFYRDWIDNPRGVKIPQGERLEDVAKRVKTKLSFILSQNEGRIIALVTHGGPIRLILCQILKYNLNKFWQIEQNNTALNIIDYLETGPVIVRMNDVSHLEEAAGVSMCQ